MQFIFLTCHILYYAFIIRDFSRNRYRIIVWKPAGFPRFSVIFSFLFQILAISSLLSIRRSNSLCNFPAQYSAIFQKNHAKNSLFDNFITKQHAVHLISAFRFWFLPQESAIFLFWQRLFCFCLLCFVEFFFDSPQNRRVSCILFASFGCKSKHLFARCWKFHQTDRAIISKTERKEQQDEFQPFFIYPFAQW